MLADTKAESYNYVSLGTKRLVGQDLLSLRLEVVRQCVLETTNQATSESFLLIGVHEQS